MSAFVPSGWRTPVNRRIHGLNRLNVLLKFKCVSYSLKDWASAWLSWHAGCAALSRGCERELLPRWHPHHPSRRAHYCSYANIHNPMEPLSGAASGMAVVSLALQLIQSVSSINAFIQAVKGAPTEITRLTSSLDRLHALLQDVCQLMELQTSRSGEHIPRPSMTIFSCLTSCQQHLLPLQDIVKSNEESQGQNHSKSLRLWSSIKLGFKTSDIMAFEARIHQEMVNLTTALMLNSTSIQ